MFLFLLGSSFFLCMQKVPWCKKKGMKIQDIALILTQEKCWQFFIILKIIEGFISLFP